jgi:hypothetical protein
MRPQAEIEEGLRLSKEVFARVFGKPENLAVRNDNMERDLIRIIMATEICTLKYVLGTNGDLNAIHDDFEDSIPKEHDKDYDALKIRFYKTFVRLPRARKQTRLL